VEAELEQVQQTLREMERKQRELPALREAVAETRAEHERVSRMVPDAGMPSINWFPEYLERVAREAGVNLGGAKSVQERAAGRGGQSGTPASVVAQGMELDHTGGFEALLRFVHLLEYGTPFVRVDRFEIQPGPTTTGEVEGAGPKQLKITVRAYEYRPQAAGAGRPGRQGS
jgi:hypothetical protein